MIAGVDVRTFQFGQPFYLWLLVLPGILVLAAVWRLARRGFRARRSDRERVLPIVEHSAVIGDAGFWLCVLCAASFGVVALARPEARVMVNGAGGADFVILQDGSASMYTRDVAPDRWQRSVRFLRAFADVVNWKRDRLALALFAHLASPQVRLTKDPNAFYFFLDHLGEHSPFRLEDDPTWDTNIEEGLYWGLDLIQKDEQLFGKSTNVKAFVVISDGQAWSGNVANAVAEAQRRHTPVYVVGVGTEGGAMIPTPPPTEGSVPSPVIRAVLDRNSLRDIARAGGGEYFELGRQSDREISSKIAASVKRSGGSLETVESHQELYWPFLFSAAVALGLGILFVRDPIELVWHILAIAGTLGVLASVFH